jgi:hypothetical protein
MVLRRMMGPSLETGAVLDTVLSGNYRAIAIACLRLPSHLFVMKKGPGSILNSAPIWQKGFYYFNVRTEQKQIEKLCYIHRNPVKRRLVGEQWEWSSFRSFLYQYQETGLVRVRFQEWPMEIKARPVAKFGEGNSARLALVRTRSAHLPIRCLLIRVRFPTPHLPLWNVASSLFGGVIIGDPALTSRTSALF